MSCTITKIPGFVSQRKFQKYMKDFRKNEQADSHIVDPVSQDLYASGNEKGRKGEYIVAGMFKDMGYDARVLSGHDRCDVVVNVGDKWLNVEVKTSGININSRQYVFNKIKPTLFDIIALVFVGHDGTTVQIGGSEAKSFIRRYGTVSYNDDGYKLYFNPMRRHHKALGQEGIWLDFTKENVGKAI